VEWTLNLYSVDKVKLNAVCITAIHGADSVDDCGMATYYSRRSASNAPEDTLPILTNVIDFDDDRPSPSNALVSGLVLS
jgi:hypothetical protein